MALASHESKYANSWGMAGRLGTKRGQTEGQASRFQFAGLGRDTRGALLVDAASDSSDHFPGPETSPLRAIQLLVSVSRA